MQPLSPIDLAFTTQPVEALLDRILDEVGMVPELLRVMAHSPSVLEGYLAIQDHLGSGRLDRRLHYRIALAVSEAHGSDYCIAAYCALGKAAGLSEEALRDARTANSPERRTQAALEFAVELTTQSSPETVGHLPKLRRAGFCDAEIVEIVAHTMLVGLVNSLCHLSDVIVDFPPVVQSW